MAKKDGWRTFGRELYGGVALVPPAVRTVIVEVFDEDDEGDPYHAVYPVVAVRSAAVLRFEKRIPEGDWPGHGGPTPEEMYECGFRFAGSSLRQEWLFLNSEGLVGSDSPAAFCSASRWEAVACTWPPSEDAEQCAEIARRILREMRPPAPAEAEEAKS